MDKRVRRESLSAVLVLGQIILLYYHTSYLIEYNQSLPSQLFFDSKQTTAELKRIKGSFLSILQNPRYSRLHNAVRIAENGARQFARSKGIDESKMNRDGRGEVSTLHTYFTIRTI